MPSAARHVTLQFPHECAAAFEGLQGCPISVQTPGMEWLLALMPVGMHAGSGSNPASLECEIGLTANTH